MFDFNAVLEATEARHASSVYGPVRIVSEEHDTAKINVEESAITDALRGAAGVWDAREYGISAEEVARRVAEANTPEARERVMVDLRRRAIRRAGLDTSNGRVNVMVAGKPAWHRLGVNVESAVSAADAIQLAGLNWSVEKRAMSWRGNDGQYIAADDAFALVRADTGAKLGTVGSRYAPIQNAAAFGFLDSVIGEFGAKFHTAGSIHGGAKVWMQCELPEHNFEVVAGDEVQTFATFTNPHDGSGRAWAFPTTNRVVCANTFTTASQDCRKGLGIRHTGDVKSKVADARRALGIAVREIDTFRENADVMVRTPINAPEFFRDLLDEVLDITHAETLKGADALAAAIAKTDATRAAEAKRIQREIDARKNLLEDILSRYDSPKNGVNGIRGTAWSAFNAVTETADHRNPARRVGNAEAQLSRRFESSLNGDADELKQTAYQMLTARR